MHNKTALCDIFLLQGNVYQQLLNSTSINLYDDRLEIDCIFNKKGKYKVGIYGNNKRGEKCDEIIEYIVNIKNDATKQLSFPQSYKGKEDINIIEPLYNNLKRGGKVKFKIKSNNLNQIIIIDGEWHHLQKNASGYFELETIIQSQSGSSVVVGKPNPNDPNS